MIATQQVSDTRQRVRAELEVELDSFFSGQRSAAESYGEAFTELWALAARHVLGGKLVRPILFLESYDALCGSISTGSWNPLPRADVIRLAVAIELLHYSFLLHDDVIDGDLVRRGHPNLIGALKERAAAPSIHITRTDSALHWARSSGMLMGDLLLAAAHQSFARADLPHETRIAMLDLLDHTIVESVAGEQADVGLSDGIISPDIHTVLAMLAQKTATYTFELPLRAAAILAGASERLQHEMTQAGRHLGLAFQLQDDLLSVFGDATAHGKDAFSDLREGKQTAITCYARSTAAWHGIAEHFGNPHLTTDQALHMRNLLSECGAERFTQRLVDEQTVSLREVLSADPDGQQIPATVRELLLNFSAQLEGRRA